MAAAHHPKPLGETLGTELATIHVSKKRKEFVVHKNLICDKSDYFDKAFRGSFVGNNGVMYLPDDTAGSIALFIDWLYKGTVSKGNTLEHFVTLVNLYIFLEKICCNDLGNRAIDEMRYMA